MCSVRGEDGGEVHLVRAPWEAQRSRSGQVEGPGQGCRESSVGGGGVPAEVLQGLIHSKPSAAL